jgi:IclR family transcriptional regulator, acetate operon repressor
MATQAPPSSVKSAMRTLDILELLARQQRPMAAHEISATLGIPVSSLSYLLSTLAERDYLARERRHYRLGPAIARFQPDTAAPDLAQRAAPIVKALTRELNETAGFFVPRGFEVEAVASEIGLQALRYTLDVGRFAPMHAFAAGKALLAAFPEKTLKLYFREVEREAFTPATLTDEAELRVALQEIARTGVARTCEEHTPGIAGTARVALIDGKPVGAFSVAVPVTRLTPAIARRIEILLARAVTLLAGGKQDGDKG